MRELPDKIKYYENILENTEDNRIDLCLEHVNNWQLCRTCLTETTKSDVDVDEICVADGPEGIFLNVQETIKYVAKLEVTDREDDLPSKVCMECLDKIKTLYYFTLQIQKAEKILKLLDRQLNLGKLNSSVVIKNEENLWEELILINEESPTQAIEVPSDVEVKKEEINHENFRYDLSTDIVESSINYNDPKNICPSNEIVFVKQEDELFVSDVHFTEQYDTDEFSLKNKSRGNLLLADENERKKFKKLKPKNKTLETSKSSSESDSSTADENERQKSKIKRLGAFKDSSDIDFSTADENERQQFKKQKFKTKTLETSKDSWESDSSTADVNERKKLKFKTNISETSEDISESYSTTADENVRKRCKKQKSRTSSTCSTYECMICQKIFTVKAHLIKHATELHPKEKAFKCPDCDMLFGHIRSLERHHDLKHKNKTNICTLCSKSYYSRNELKIHLRTHTGERPFSCTFCEKTFPRKSSLVRHQTIHMENESKGHKCPFCSKTYGILSRLKDHMVVHTRERPHKCSFCDKTFTLQANLIKHQKTQHEDLADMFNIS